MLPFKNAFNYDTRAAATRRYNPALPLAALKILAVLGDRVERLVDLLPQPAAAALVEAGGGYESKPVLTHELERRTASNS